MITNRRSRTIPAITLKYITYSSLGLLSPGLNVYGPFHTSSTCRSK